MSVTPSPIGGFAAQFFDNNGQPLSGGKIYTYVAGTTTPLATYTSAAAGTPHSNPIILDSAGRVPGGEIWLTDGLVYKFVIETSTGALIGTYDNITGVNSNFVNYTVQEEVQTATAGQTVFNLATINYTPATNSLSVYIDGVNQYVGDSYLETDSNTVTFTAGLHVGAEVKFTTAVQVATGTTVASDVGYTLPAVGAAPQNVQTKLEQSISINDFGASPSASAAVNDAAIAAAVTYCNTLTRPKLIIPDGEYTISATANFDLPNYSTIEFIGSFVTSTGLPAVRIGSTSANRFGYRVTGLKVRRASVDTAGSSVGVQIRNIVWSYIDIRSVVNFRDGVFLLADQSNGGVSYNEIHFGQLHDNRTNLLVQSNGTAGGYANENVFFGGSFNHTSGYPAVSTINIKIDYDGVYRNNNNRFFCPSLEDNSTLAVAAVINGDNNLIFHPRLERPTSASTYEIQFTANSRECQIIGNGFALLNSNINDLGDTNSYSTREGATYKAQTAASAGKAVYSGQSTAASAAKIYSAKDASGVETAYITGEGRFYSAQDGYFQTGIRYSTSSGTFQDRGLFVGSGSPEGVVAAQAGSLYCNTAGGVGTTLYVKQSGSGNTGWVGK
jgi:hypothetical protein